MSIEKVDLRMPDDLGSNVLKNYAAVKTPWEKLISYYDAYEYGCRHMAGIAAVFFETIRVFLPDYAERMEELCKTNKMMMGIGFKGGFEEGFAASHARHNNIHPFMEGGFISSLYGDSGDERLLMNGRVNDFGTYRAEKELDTCPWDILGSEICRISPCGQQGIGEAYAGPRVEFNMPEARGCGDPQCRLICENRDKYPMPEREVIWETFGPLATMDQIKVTPKEKRFGIHESQYFRKATNFACRNGVSAEFDHLEGWEGGPFSNFAGDYVTYTYQMMMREGKLKQEEIDNVIECVFEACGKMMFLDSYAVKGVRDFLGVPNDIADGRVLGAYIELLLQIARTEYKILAFNKDEVIYDIDRVRFMRRSPMLIKAYNALFYGMCKTLVSAEWFCWEETEDVPEGRWRIKIARKVDKYCR